MPKNILLVDDDPEVLKIVIHYFKEFKKPYSVFHAPNGQVGCEVAIKKLPDLILMDWEMPVMNGLEAMTYLKLQPSTQYIPIVMATGRMVKDEHLQEAFAKGAIDYVRKPLNAIELIARVQAALAFSEVLHQTLEQKNVIEAKSTDLKRQYGKEKELLKAIIDHKARELSVGMVKLAHQTELLNQIKTSLAQPISPQQTSQLIATIEAHISTSNAWDKFKLHFESVHPHFFDRLQNRYPQLTKNELRLCAYIKMRLGNKEMASLFNLSVKGMESARYRLKKKFRLSAQNDLDQFIGDM